MSDSTPINNNVPQFTITAPTAEVGNGFWAMLGILWRVISRNLQSLDKVSNAGLRYANTIDARSAAGEIRAVAQANRDVADTLLAISKLPN